MHVRLIITEIRRSSRDVSVWRTYLILLSAFQAVIALSSSTLSRADEVADFYKGKTLTIGIGVTPGGGYDLYARTLARFIGKESIVTAIE